MYYEMIGFTSEPHGDPCTPGVPDVELSKASVFLDFDGTLVDLADAPDAIDVAPDLPKILRAIADRCDNRLVIVTGRAVASVRPYLGDFAGPIIGGHGAEEHWEGVTERQTTLDETMLSHIGKMTESFAATHEGLLAELKPTGVVLHFRKNEDQAAAAYAFLRVLCETHPGFDLHHSKMAYELRPQGIGKDISVRHVMARDGFVGTTPVYFGDDVTDEPALHWVASVGGLAVKVGDGDTAASSRVETPKAVRDILRTWARV